MGTTKKLWKGLEELQNGPEFIQQQQNEFAEEIPLEKLLGDEKIENSSTSRRDFLKFLGFSVTAASLAACETPVNKAIPYVVKPEEVTPGVANWYASTYFDGNDYAGILVKTREGRPIKVEGNTLSPINKGGTNARIQGSVLSLYDGSRIKGPYAKGAESTWDTVDKEIGSKLTSIASTGGAIRILSSTIISPSTKAAIAEFAAKYGNVKHVQYDAVSCSGMLKANWNSFEKAVLPTYHFEKAKVIVSIGADFLLNWVSPIEHAKGYSMGRKLSKANSEMSKHVQFESNLSLTGANADERAHVKPSHMGATVANLYNAVAALCGGTAVASSATPADAKIAETAKWLAANKGASLVVCGVNDTACQVLVNGINTMLNNYGSTLDMDSPSYVRQGMDDEFAELVNDMKAGKVAALITYNTNPVYTAPASAGFAEAYKKVGLKVSFADRIDETAEWADYVCPDSHYLESWNDANPSLAHYSLQQPAIMPLFAKPRHEGTRQAQQTLLHWAGNKMDYHSYIQKIWSERVYPMQGKYMMFTEFWNNSLHDGAVTVGTGKVLMPSGETDSGKDEAKNTKKDTVSISGAGMFKQEMVVDVKTEPAPKMSAGEAAGMIAKWPKGGAFELALYEKAGPGNGLQANNPWLQELPDPITRVTWDNYVTMSPIDMKIMNLSLMERQDRDASLVNITVGGVTLKLPVFPQPGQMPGTVGIALGYGRTKAGMLSDKVGVVGQNAYPLVQMVNNQMMYAAFDVKIENANEYYKLAGTQIHHTMMGRHLAKSTTLEEFKKDASAGNEREMLHTHSGLKNPTDVTLWDKFDRLGHRWGLTIDLTSCIGCGACVVGCTAENNVAVVGKDQVMRTREMLWIRIDRYYESDMNEHVAEEKGEGAVSMYLDMEKPAELNPKVIFQPVMCQHCNQAPCETVCPVIATNHTSDGLNVMTYNRCVGTRYCANNCPYKVRRFNWYNYNANTDYTFNPAQDDLGRMVLNPDVVVRSRGVMEKCSMCIQRVQAGKLEAKKAGAKLVDGSIQTACAQACPTNAIVFGDLNDAESAVTKARDERNYFMLEEMNFQPTVSYKVKVRNCAPTEMHHEEKHEEHQEEKHEEKHEEKKES